jgi:AraC-like DNA-binding protein
MSPDKRRFEANRQELSERIFARCHNDGQNDIVESLQFFRYTSPTQPKHGLYLPAICVVAQGAKEVLFGGEKLRYDPANYLLISLDMPVVSQVVEATVKKPYLGLKLDIDSTIIASVMVESGLSPGRQDASIKSMDVSKLQDDLLDAFVRLIRLLDDREDYRTVSPLVVREIVYRVLKSEQGPRLRQMAAVGGHTHRMTKAVQLLRARFKESFRIEDIAGELGMSASSFHEHFKIATSMSPLQFQKSLRLQEARRLLLSESMDASEAAVQVGYDDASQFSREYKRLFGEPPMRDVSRFKQFAAHVG